MDPNIQGDFQIYISVLLTSLWLLQLKTVLSEGRVNFKRRFLKIFKLSEIFHQFF